MFFGSVYRFFYKFGFWKTVTETLCGKVKTEPSVNRIFRFGFRFNRKNRMRTCSGTRWPGGCGPAVPGGEPAILVAAGGGLSLVGGGTRCHGGRLATRRPGTGGESAGDGPTVNRQATVAALERLG
jgi:hypothetical protein